MSLNNKKRTTYRLSPELDQLINEQATKLGISKNAFVQLTLMNALQNNNSNTDNRLNAPPNYCLPMNT